MGASRYPGAIWVPGPRGRVSGSPQPKHGAIYHSMVGKARPADTAHSWHFSIFKSGRIEQHYGANAWCWHAGDRDDPAGDISNNRDLIGIEHEGGPPGNFGEPLTPAQIASDIRLTYWLVQEDHIHNLTRIGSHRGLWEHNEIRATACPSNRIKWVLIIAGVKRLVEGEMEMAKTYRVSGSNTVYVHTGTEIKTVKSGAALTRLKQEGLIPAKAKVISAGRLKQLQADVLQA